MQTGDVSLSESIRVYIICLTLGGGLQGRWGSLGYGDTGRAALVMISRTELYRFCSTQFRIVEAVVGS